MKKNNLSLFLQDGKCCYWKWQIVWDWWKCLYFAWQYLKHVFRYRWKIWDSVYIWWHTCFCNFGALVSALRSMLCFKKDDKTSWQFIFRVTRDLAVTFFTCADKTIRRLVFQVCWNSLSMILSVSLEVIYWQFIST